MRVPRTLRAVGGSCGYYTQPARHGTVPSARAFCACCCALGSLPWRRRWSWLLRAANAGRLIPRRASRAGAHLAVVRVAAREPELRRSARGALPPKLPAASLHRLCGVRPGACGVGRVDRGACGWLRIAVSAPRARRRSTDRWCCVLLTPFACNSWRSSSRPRLELLTRRPRRVSKRVRRLASRVR